MIESVVYIPYSGYRINMNVVVVVVLWFAFSIIHGNRSVAKHGEGLGAPIT